MLDFTAAVWNGMVPLWGASWWWMAIVGAVAGIVLDVLIEEDNPVILAMLGGALLGCWPLVVLIGAPFVVGFLVWAATWTLKEWWEDFQKRKAEVENQPVPEEPDSMTVESPDLYHKDDLK